MLDAGEVDRALDGVDLRVIYLAGLPGMWTPGKDDFHTVNFKTQIVLAAARRNGVARFLHC